MLTLRENDALSCIESYIEKHGYSPTMEELASAMGIKSRGVAHRYVSALETAGRIEIIPKRHRNIKVVKTGVAANGCLPLLGRIAAGQPIEAIPDRDAVNIANIFLKENRYALEVKGDSMIEEGILDGDIVVCEETQSANDGQIVVALVDNSETTLKRLRRNTDQTITLIPANSEYKPLTYECDRVIIQGIFVGLLRFLAL